MSAVAAARKRRAGPMPPDPAKNVPVVSQPPSQPAPSGLTLPQVIALVDKRLVVLEKFMNDSSTKEPTIVSSTPLPIEPQTSAISDETLQDIHDVLDDYNARFILLSEEIGNLKDIILKLQSFTMDVNKKLVDERLGNVEFVLEDPITNPESDEIEELDPSSSSSTDEVLATNENA